MDNDYDSDSAQDAQDMSDSDDNMMGQKGGMSNPAMVENYLKGVDYPASKQDLMDKARENGAPDEVMDTLSGLPDQSYDNPTNVTEAMGNKM